MSDETRKVTVRFETSDEITDNATESDILLSGPVSIFATVDLFEELEDEALLNAIEDASGREIIVYCKDVRDRSNTSDQTHRGAYFYYTGMVEGKPNWQEVLLGTHSHANIDRLERLTELLGENKNADMSIVLKSNGAIELVPVESGLQLPTLPLEVLRKKALLEREYNIPAESEDHHLDAELSELEDTYDWMGEHNTAIGSCRSLYRKLVLADDPLKISDVYPEVPEGLKEKVLNLELIVLDFNTDKKETLPGALKVERLTTSGEFSVAIYTPWKFYRSDKIFLFNNGEFISTEQYKVLPEFEKDAEVTDKVILKFSRGFEKYKEDTVGREITLLLVEKVANYDGIISDTIKELNLEQINDELTARSVRGALSRKPQGSKHYLTVDASGKISWEKAFLPTQMFYCFSGEATVREIDTLARAKKCVAEYTFKDAYLGEDDHPILMVNEQFAFNAKYEQQGADLKVSVDLDDFYDFVDFDGVKEDKKFIFNIIIVRNSASKSVAEEFDRKYITKEDAVAILSHGHLHMDDYAKVQDLLGYSKVGHTHAGYAKKEHNHDYRYANFHHTHPEIAKLIAAASKGELDESKLKDWLEEFEDKNTQLFAKLIESLGLLEKSGKYFLTEDNMLIQDEELINKINEKSKEHSIDELDPNVSVYLKDILERIILFFEHDTVTTKQVVLDRDLPVRLVNGPVGGIDTVRTYKTGEHTLQEILEDILNPYVLSERVKEILTPSEKESIIKFYSEDAAGKKVEIDLEHLEYADDSTMLYMTVELKNKEGNPCRFNGVNSLGMELIQEALPVVYKGDEEIFPELGGFYSLFDISMRDSDTYEPAVKISWVSNQEGDIVFDNYGNKDETPKLLNPDHNSFTKEITTQINYPDLAYSYGTGEHEGEIIPVYRGKELRDLKTSIGHLNVYIENDLYKNLVIFDLDTGYNLTRVFTDNGDKPLYEGYYKHLSYEFLNPDEVVNIKLFIRN